MGNSKSVIPTPKNDDFVPDAPNLDIEPPVPQKTKKIQKKENTSKQFVGIEGIKSTLLYGEENEGPGLEKFRKYAEKNEWYRFGPDFSHYDWWMFPVNNSGMKGLRYAVFSNEINILKKDIEFMKNYKEGCELVFLSWGWDLRNSCAIENQDVKNGQKWRNWNVRFKKIKKSLYLFGEETYFNSCNNFIQYLSDNEQIKKVSYKILLSQKYTKKK